MTIVTKLHFKGEPRHRIGENSGAKPDFLQLLLMAMYRLPQAGLHRLANGRGATKAQPFPPSLTGGHGLCGIGCFSRDLTTVSDCSLQLGVRFPFR